MTEVPINISRRGAVLEIVIDRPKANALDANTSRILGEVFHAFRDDPDFLVAIIAGSGSQFFCAGRDPVPADELVAEDYGVGGFGGFQELVNLNKPVIAAVNGIAVGGGVEMALAADMVFAAPNARFSLPEVKAGAISEAAAVRLPRRIPHHIAMEMLYTGRWMDAKEAMRLGLVNEIVESGDLMERVRTVAKMLSENAPLAMAAIKEAARETAGLAFPDAMGRIRQRRLPAVAKLFDSEDFKEGKKAVAEKRKPVWRGR